MWKYWYLARARILLLGFLPMLAGVLLGAKAFGWRRDAVDFLEHLNEAHAQIVPVEQAAAGDFQFDAVYRDEIGLEYRKLFRVPASREAALRTAGTIGVVYDKRSPLNAKVGNVVTISTEARGATALCVLAVALILWGAIYLIRSAARISKIGKLFQRGQMVETSVRDHGQSARAGRFTYAFRGLDGRWYEGKSPEFPVSYLGRWPVGHPVHIVFDESNPRRTEPDVFGVLRRSGRLQQANDRSPK